MEEGTGTLLFAGVNTDQCVLGTLVDAYNAGWNCVLVDDCCGTTTEGGREVSLWNVSVSFIYFISFHFSVYIQYFYFSLRASISLSVL